MRQQLGESLHWRDHAGQDDLRQQYSGHHSNGIVSRLGHSGNQQSKGDPYQGQRCQGKPLSEKAARQIREVFDDPQQQRCLKQAEHSQQKQLGEVIAGDRDVYVAFAQINDSLLDDLLGRVVAPEPKTGDAQQEDQIAALGSLVRQQGNPIQITVEDDQQQRHQHALSEESPQTSGGRQVGASNTSWQGFLPGVQRTPVAGLAGEGFEERASHPDCD